MIVIIVDGATSEASKIVQHWEKLATDVVTRTTSKTVCKSSEGSLHRESRCDSRKGLIGPRENVHIDVVYMKFARMSVMMMTTVAWGA